MSGGLIASLQSLGVLACSLTYLDPPFTMKRLVLVTVELNSVWLSVCSVVTFCRMNVLVTNFGIPCRRAIRNILFSPHPEFLNLICWVCDNYSKILENFYFLHFAINFFKLRGHKLMALHRSLSLLAIRVSRQLVQHAVQHALEPRAAHRKVPVQFICAAPQAHVIGF